MLRLTILILCCIFGIRVFFVEPFRTPTSFMEPTIKAGDYVLVSKYAYGYGKYSFPITLPWLKERLFGKIPQRGDVVVFRVPGQDEKILIKRLVGLPGDKVQIHQGRLFINGHMMSRRFQGTVIQDYSRQQTEFKIYEEILSLPDSNRPDSNVADLRGISSQKESRYFVQEISDVSYLDETMVFSVPEKHFFVMGDNRDLSSDSRSDIGYLSMNTLIGRAVLVVYSLDYEGSVFAFWKWPFSIDYARIFQFID